MAPPWEYPRRDTDWTALEAALGAPLPQALRDLADAYGAGVFGQALGLGSPAAWAPELDWQHAAHRAGDQLARLAARMPRAAADLPFKLTSGPGGLVWWADGIPDELAGAWLWQRGQDPDAWPTVLLRRDDPRQHHVVEDDPVGVLLGLLGGTIELPWVRDSLPGQPLFEPYLTERQHLAAAQRPANWVGSALRPAPSGTRAAPDSVTARPDPEALAELEELAPPPADHPPAVPGDLRLPQSHRALLERYGPGHFDGWLTTFAADGDDPFDSIQGATEAFAERHRASGLELPLHPDPGHLVVWGFAEPELDLCWDTRLPDPDEWPTVIVVPEGARLEVHPLTTASFIADALTGVLETTALDAPLVGQHDFEPG